MKLQLGELAAGRTRLLVGILFMVGVTIVLALASATYLAPIDPALGLTYESHGNGTLDVTVQNADGRVVLTDGGTLRGETYATLNGNDTARLMGLTEGDTVTILLDRDGWGYVTSLKYTSDVTEPVALTFEMQDRAFVCHPSALRLCI